MHGLMLILINNYFVCSLTVTAIKFSRKYYEYHFSTIIREINDSPH